MNGKIVGIGLLAVAVIAGGGIGCLSRTMVENDVDVGRLVRLDVADFTLSRALSLARPKAIWRNRLARTFDQFLLDRGDGPPPA